MLVYVDDILVTCNDENTIQKIFQQLSACFSIKDPKDLNFFFRIEVHLTSAGLHLSQTKYIINVHQKHVMTEAKPVKTPMTSYPKLTMSSGTQLSDPTSYRQLVGSLQYLDF